MRGSPFITSPKATTHAILIQLFQAIDVTIPETDRKVAILILGIIKYVHIRKDVLDEDGTVNPGLLKPVSQLGDTSYGRLESAYRIPLPSWNEDNRQIYDALKP